MQYKLGTVKHRQPDKQRALIIRPFNGFFSKKDMINQNEIVCRRNIKTREVDRKESRKR